MANKCYNQVTFRGPEEARLQARLCFTALAEKGFGLPDFVGKECGVFFDLSQEGDSIIYHTRYDPNLNAVAQVAEHFGLDYTHDYQESNMAVMGEATCINGEYGITRVTPSDINLAEYNPACEHFAYDGKFYDTIYELLPQLLEDKKAIVASEPVKLRLEGKLPHMEIKGANFIIDWANKKLVETASPGNVLEIGTDALNKNGNGICFFYDPRSHKLVNGSHAIQTLPPETCILEFPTHFYLDPVASAREEGLYDTDLLLAYPYREQQVCPVTTVAEILANQVAKKQTPKL